DVLPRTSDFDILLWWKLSGPKYPILQAIARDVLTVPVTSVASESAFSSGGRLIDHHRSKLHVTTVEAFMCTRSWLMDNRECETGQRGNLELEGCFTGADYEAVSDDEPHQSDNHNKLTN
ncbi:Putative AC transposase, partial [Linum perenne]